MRTFSKLSLIAAASLVSAAAIAAPTDIHPAANPSNSTWTNGVSSDGLVSVGRSNIGGSSRAFKIVGGAYTQLDNLLGGSASRATAASPTGSLIVGTSIDSLGSEQAVFWTSTTPTQLDSILTPLFLQSSANGVSANGGTFVGNGFGSTSGVYEAFYFQNATLTSLAGAFVGAPFSTWSLVYSFANGVSADGNLAVGTVADSDLSSAPNYAYGFVYKISTSTLTTVDAAANVPAFANAALSLTQLTAISGDGTVAVGMAFLNASLSDAQAFKHTLAGAGSTTALGTLGNSSSWSIARAINYDGSVIVGQSQNSSGQSEAFVHQSGAMTGLGFLGTGDESDATGVSADGTVIVGYSRITSGSVRHAFVYANQTMLDADEWLRSLNGPGSILAMTTNLNQLPLEGAHHRPLMSYDNMGKPSQAWATGDFGTASRQSDRHMTSGEIGVSQTYGDFVLGIAAGHASLNQDLLFGGSASISGNYLLAEADYRLADKESIVSLVLMRGDYDADTTRGYATGSGTDTSRGSTGLKTSSARLRLDGPAQKFISAVSATPFISYTATRTTANDYTETGGSFPASFGAQEHTAQEGRLGVTAKYVASPSTTLLFTAEWIHRFDGAGNGLTAISSTMGTLPAAGIAPTADQARFGFDIDHKLSADTLLNFSVHAAGIGPSSDVSAALSIRRAF
jgi:probable HAF family extracellular repeat protein